jgi:integrase/recombinase XerD
MKGAPMNREVNLTKRVLTAHGWRYCRVVLAANGRVKPDLVVVNGKQEGHPEGAYYQRSVRVNPI